MKLPTNLEKFVKIALLAFGISKLRRLNTWWMGATETWRPCLLRVIGLWTLSS